MGWRGEVSCTLGGTAVVLRPSFAAIVQIETHFDAGILTVARRFHAGEIERIGDYVAIIGAGLLGSGAVVPDDLGDQVAATGLAELIVPVGTLLARACGIRG